MARLGQRREWDHLTGEVVGYVGHFFQRDDLGHESDSVRFLRVYQAGG